LISVGLQEAIRAHGRPDASSAGKMTTLSSTIRSGWSSSMISVRWSSTYLAPSISAWKVGAMNSPSCSIVGLARQRPAEGADRLAVRDLRRR
jgi:hypothetical protein